MAVTVNLVREFERLNDDRSLYRIQSPASREREAVVDITYDSRHQYSTGGDTIDFSGIRGFTQVYLCQVVQDNTPLSSGHLLFKFLPSWPNNDARTGKIVCMAFPSTGAAQLPNNSNALRGVRIRAIIRGI